MIIRPAIREDLPGILEIYNEAFTWNCCLDSPNEKVRVCGSNA
jgi:hypothetical protein